MTRAYYRFTFTPTLPSGSDGRKATVIIDGNLPTVKLAWWRTASDQKAYGASLDMTQWEAVGLLRRQGFTHALHLIGHGSLRVQEMRDGNDDWG